MTPAVQYLRMSSEHQRYSFENQVEVIARYAAAHRYEIKRTYQDHARSGLRLTGRVGLQTLLADALRADRDFNAILVLDVSRWGRFQDLDQGAHYEFICRASGVPVVYCHEPFENDASTRTALVKQLKRLMAAEYSRELSRKTTAARLQQARLGHRQGAPLVYGVQRVLMSADGQERGVLERGQCKAQSDDYVLLRPGPESELAVVRRIFCAFAGGGCTASEIAAELNARGVPFIGRRRWSREVILRLIQHELMIGQYVFNRRSWLLKGQRKFNPPEDWVRVAVFEPIVAPKLFARAQLRIPRPLSERHTRPELLAALTALYRKRGHVSAALINQCREMPGAATYQRHFGTLLAAYEQAGIPVSRRAQITSATRMRTLLRRAVSATEHPSSRLDGPGVLLARAHSDPDCALRTDDGAAHS